MGRCCAWLLTSGGHRVTLVDQAPDPPSRSGSAAALGLLMAQVYQRSSGRGWRLRQRSLALLQEWQGALAEAGQPVELRRGLLLLASSTDEWLRQQQLGIQRQARGFPLALRSRSDLQAAVAQGHLPPLPQGVEGALWSPEDGQLDPSAWAAALRTAAIRQGLQEISGRVTALRQLSPGDPQAPWQLELADGSQLSSDWVLVCAGLGSPSLLAPLGIERPMEPVLGQAVELQLALPLAPGQDPWAGCLVWQGMNLVPRPGGRLWLGASLEPGTQADPKALETLLSLGGTAPAWLRNAELVSHWQGLRCRPVGRPAPLLEQPLPRLLLLSGHYRNGILLGPASAEWAAQQIEDAMATTGQSDRPT